MRLLRTGLAAALLLSVMAAPCRGMDAESVYRNVKDSLLIIYVEDGYTQDGKSRWRYNGTGFAVGDGALAVTNQHVANDKGTSVRVKTLDGESLIEAEVIRFSVDNDLAILRLAQTLPPLELAPDEIRVGQEVAALGNPAGFMGTLSTGVVSGLRTFPRARVKALVQTTAPTSPGSSGSPLLDVRGRVLGVVCSGYDDGQNLNFAVPVSKLRELLGRDLLPEAGEERRMPPLAGGNLDVEKAPDGSITIIQKRKR